MESYWCCKKNTIPGMMKNPENYNPALAPSLNANSGETGGASISVKWEKKDYFFFSFSGSIQ